MAFDLNLHQESGSLPFLPLSQDGSARSHFLPDGPRESPSQRLLTKGWLRVGKVMGLHRRLKGAELTTPLLGIPDWPHGDATWGRKGPTLVLGGQWWPPI